MRRSESRPPVGHGPRAVGSRDGSCPVPGWLPRSPRDPSGGAARAAPWARQAESLRRPLERRFAMMERPARVAMRERKPWVFARRRVLGWKVRLLIAVSDDRWTSGVRCSGRWLRSPSEAHVRCILGMRCTIMGMRRRPTGLRTRYGSAFIIVKPPHGSRSLRPTARRCHRRRLQPRRHADDLGMHATCSCSDPSVLLASPPHHPVTRAYPQSVDNVVDPSVVGPPAE